MPGDPAFPVWIIPLPIIAWGVLMVGDRLRRRYTCDQRCTRCRQYTSTDAPYCPHCHYSTLNSWSRSIRDDGRELALGTIVPLVVLGLITREWVSIARSTEWKTFVVALGLMIESAFSRGDAE